MFELNCLGDMCPVPLMKLQQCRELHEGEAVKLVTDHSCVCESVTGFCKKSHLSLRIVEPINGIWEMVVCRPPQGEPLPGDGAEEEEEFEDD